MTDEYIKPCPDCEQFRAENKCLRRRLRQLSEAIVARPDWTGLHCKALEAINSLDAPTVEVKQALRKEAEDGN